MDYCYNCMEKLHSGKFCSVCGSSNDAIISQPHQLPPGTVLRERFLLGRVLSAGFSGITYMSRDLSKDRKVVIREFFPQDCVNRVSSLSPQIIIGNNAGFEAGKAKFMQEIQALADLRNMPGIVNATSYFEANGTCYLVLEQLEGKTLEERLKAGPLQPDALFRLMEPVMDALEAIHEKNLIHRAVSPDNMLLTTDGRLVLLDFGEERSAAEAGTTHASVVVKQGYAPLEQYQINGKTGPWTDVYGLCATIYRALTGVQPQDATERVMDDQLKRPSQYGVQLTAAQENALMKGLAVPGDERFRSIGALKAALQGAAPEPEVQTQVPAYGAAEPVMPPARTEAPQQNTPGTVETPKPKEKPGTEPGGQKKNRAVLIVGIVVVVLMLCAGIFALVHHIQSGKKAGGTGSAASAAASGTEVTESMLAAEAAENAESAETEAPDEQAAEAADEPETAAADVPAAEDDDSGAAITLPGSAIESGGDSEPEVIQGVISLTPDKQAVLGVPDYTEGSTFLNSKFQREQIRTVTFRDTLADAPEDAVDISANGDCSVLMWGEACDGPTTYDLNKDGTDDLTRCDAWYDITIAGNGTISAPANLANLFRGCTALTSIQFRNCLDTTATTNMSGMFDACYTLTDVDVEAFNTSNVTNMSYMFRRCFYLTTVDVSGFKTSNVTDMGSMFYRCTHLKALDLSNFDTSSVTAMSGMFESCKALTELDLSSFDTSDVTTMDEMFYNCTYLSKLNVTSFNTFAVTSMYGMFSYCTSLKGLDVSSFNTSHVTDMSGMFRGCTALTDLDTSGFVIGEDTDTTYMFEGVPGHS